MEKVLGQKENLLVLDDRTAHFSNSGLESFGFMFLQIFQQASSRNGSSPGGPSMQVRGEGVGIISFTSCGFMLKKKRISANTDEQLGLSVFYCVVNC